MKTRTNKSDDEFVSNWQEGIEDQFLLGKIAEPWFKTPPQPQLTNPKVLHHVALLVLRDVYDQTDWLNEDLEKVQKQIDLSQTQLSPAERAESVSLADELVSQYEMTIREYVEDDYQDKYDYWREEIEYDEELYEVWKEAVRNRQTVKIKYDSTTSGVSERLVDPYASRAPYVDGYCHTRNEVRMFRLDRVLELTLTDQKFEKIKDWRMNQFG